MKGKVPVFLIIIAGLIGATVLFLPLFIVMVDTGKVGVVSVFGNVSPTYLDEGLHVKNPFAKVTMINARTQAYTMSAVANEGNVMGDDSVEIITVDGAKLHVDMTVWYRIEKEKAPEVYRNIGKDYEETIVRPTIRSSIRGVFAEYKVVEAYATKREEITQKIKKQMTDILATKGIIVDEALLRDVKLSAALSASIEQKLAAQQEAEKYDYILEKEKKEAERKIIEARAQRDAQQLVTQGLTSKYLQYLYIMSLKDREGTIYVPTEGGMPLFKEVK